MQIPSHEKSEVAGQPELGAIHNSDWPVLSLFALR
jgi:hypothetical protein